MRIFVSNKQTMTKIVSKFGWGIAAIIVFLIVIMVFIAALSADANGQTVNSKVGFNAPNAVESFTTQADSNYLLELVPENTNFSWRYRYDKLDTDPEGLIDLYQFMKKNNRGFWVIYVASDSVPLEQNIEVITQLKNAGIPVLATSYVNEPFYDAGGYSFNWELYEPGYEAYCAAITEKWPDMEILLAIAPMPLSLFTKTQGGQANHDTWNNAGFYFKSTHPQYNISGADVHIYYKGTFVEALGKDANTDETGSDKVKIDAPDLRVYNYLTDTIDESYWKDIFYQSIPSTFWEPMLNYLTSHDLLVYATETGYIDAGSLNGSFTYAAKIFELTNWYGDDPRVKSFNLHGGPITGSKLGVIGPRKKWDIKDPDNPNNVRSATFDAYSLYFNTPGEKYKYPPAIITKAGTYSYWFCNGLEAFTPNFAIANGLTGSYYVQYIKGNKFSSLSRSMDFTQRNSVLGPDEVSEILTGETCPALSFGYVVLTVTGTDILGCTDTAAFNYDPLATSDNGTCIPKVYGCREPQASNYNPLANTDAVCIYVQCLQKRWLFKSLPCKQAKRNCNCND